MKPPNTSPSVRQNEAEPSSEEATRGFWNRSRNTGEEFTGGVILAFGKLLILKFLRRLMGMVFRRPRLMVLTHNILRSSPRLSWRLNRLVEIVDPLAGRPYLPSGRLSKFVDLMAVSLPESSRTLYLRLRAIASDTGSWNRP